MRTFEDLGIQTSRTTGKEKTFCPKCSHMRKKSTERCLGLSHEEKWFKCHNCGWSGTIKEDARTEMIKDDFQLDEWSGYTEKFKKYFKERGISEETVKKSMIYARTHYFPSVGKKLPCAVYPVFWKGNILTLKFKAIEKVDGKRPSTQLSKDDYGSEQIFIGMNHVKTVDDGEEYDYIMITEGEEDMLSLREVGYTNVISMPQGAPNPDSKNLNNFFAFLEHESAKLVRGFAKIYFVTDNDDNGNFLDEQMAYRLGKEKVKLVSYPDDCKDINDVLVKHGTEEIKRCISNKRPFPISGIVKVSDVHRGLEKLRHKGFERGYLTGHDWIDKYFSVKPKQFSVWTGLSGSGKSVFKRWYITELMRNNPGVFHCCIFSPEDRPVERMIARIIESFSRQQIFEGDPNSMSDKVFNEAKRWVDKHFTFISPDTKEKKMVLYGDEIKGVSTLKGIFNLAKYSVENYGTNYLLVDPWNKVNKDKNRGETDKDFIDKALDYFLEFGTQMNAHVSVVAHPVKGEKAKDEVNYKMPTLYNISGSADWKNKVDSGIILHRDKYNAEDGKIDSDAPTKIFAEKHKHEEIGKEGMTQCYMDYYRGKTFVPHKDDRYTPSKSEFQKGRTGQKKIDNVNAEEYFTEPTEEAPF